MRCLPVPGSITARDPLRDNSDGDGGPRCDKWEAHPVGRYFAFMSTKMALVVRTDLAMGKGKIAAQAAHAAVAAVMASVGTKATTAWLKDGQPKVVLRVPDMDALLLVCANATASGLPTQRVEDAGRTQVSAGTVTCCAIGPALASEIDVVTGSLPLL